MNPFLLLIRIIVYLVLVTYIAGMLLGSAMARDHVTMAVLCVMGALVTTNRAAIIGVKGQ
jgi:hypothetical protein